MSSPSLNAQKEAGQTTIQDTTAGGEKQRDLEPSAKTKTSLLRRVWNLRDYTPYPRAHDNRVSIHAKEVRVSRLALVKAAVQNFILLQILFFTLFCYIFGSIYKQGQLVHRMNVAFVDYDGGAIGEAVRAAYAQERSDSFPSLQERPASEYPDVASLTHAVCRADYWGALYITKGSSVAVANALTDGTDGYDKNNVMGIVWNEARYSSVIDTSIATNLQTLSTTTKSIYAAQDWSNVTNSQNAFSIFVNPWTLASNDIQPTSQGSRLIYNTLVIILILIQEFFYLGALNQLYELFKIYQRLQPRRIIFFRNLFSLCYCLMGSLFVTIAIWTFKSGWHVNGAQFMLTWMVLWLFAHLNFLTLDVFTVWLPPPFVPMALISWVVMNVTSILLPFELQSDFYKWGYAMPAHEVYNTLVDIWSGGCNPVVRYSLPVLFSFEISSFTLAALGIYKRCHYAVIRAEGENAAFQDRIDTALAFEKQRRLEDREREQLSRKDITGANMAVGSSDIEAEEAAEDEKEKEDLGRVMQSEYEKLRKLRSSNAEKGGYGPRFGFALGCPSEGDDDDDAADGPVPRDDVENQRPGLGMRMISRRRTAGAENSKR